MKLIKHAKDIKQSSWYYLVDKKNETTTLTTCISWFGEDFSNSPPKETAIFVVGEMNVEFVDDKGLKYWHVIGPVEVESLGDISQYLEPESGLSDKDIERIALRAVEIIKANRRYLQTVAMGNPNETN